MKTELVIKGLELLAPLAPSKHFIKSVALCERSTCQDVRHDVLLTTVTVESTPEETYKELRKDGWYQEGDCWAINIS